jgi:hypothetical protein
MARIIHAVLVCSWLVGCGFAQTSIVPTDHVKPAGVMSTTEVAPVCYSCFFQSYAARLNPELINFFKFQFKTADPLVAGDARFIVWRAMRTLRQLRLDRGYAWHIRE